MMPFHLIEYGQHAALKGSQGSTCLAGASGSEPEPEEIYRRPAALEAAAAQRARTCARSWEWYRLGEASF